MIPNRIPAKITDNLPIPAFGMFSNSIMPFSYQLYNNFPHLSIFPRFINPTLSYQAYQGLNPSFMEFEADNQLIESKCFLKFEDTPSFCKIPVSSPTIIKINPIEVKTESETIEKNFEESKILLNLPDDPEICFEAQIKYIVQFFVNNYGIVAPEEFQKTKNHYNNNLKLKAVVEILEKKYSNSNKTREEMIKWIIRRSLKTCQQRLKGGKNKNQKKLLNDLCKKYFINQGYKSKSDEDEEEGDSNGDEDGDECDLIIDSVLPFRKNSKNKTMNSKFLTELFQSDDFKQDFQLFLEEFDEIAKEENAEKLQRFTRLIIDYSKKGTLNKLIKYKRVPWLKLWLQNTKSLALELEKGELMGKSSKKSKISN